MSASEARKIYVRYEVPASRDDWELAEDDLVPESQPHDIVSDQLKSILLAWVARTGRSAQVARNLAIRWDRSRPKIGVDPDLCIVEPRTPEGDELMSLCTWRPGNTAPKLAIEIVRSNGACKDYVSAPHKYAASGTEELWVLDPKLAGPSLQGGPFFLQMWRRIPSTNPQGSDEFVRLYAGPGPARSEYLGAFFVADEERRVRICEGAHGEKPWLTEAEAALARVAELEAQLATMRGK